MKSVSSLFYKYDGQNPFIDNQARNFSDEKVSSEFYPVSSFWSLFNDQHEIIIGSRGSGKTFLLKMMRYSMLKRIESIKAKKLVEEKKYIAIYVPMHLEFINSAISPYMTVEEKRKSFLTAFNCLLAQSFLHEIESILTEYNAIDQARKTVEISQYINYMWFKDSELLNYSLSSLADKVDSVFYKTPHYSNGGIEEPAVFHSKLFAPLLSVKEKIESILNLANDPTWIICIDEAEFLDEDIQKMINSVFRSDSNKIAIKMATLPYMHVTLETIDSKIRVSEVNDFSYKVIDMAYDSHDFVSLTNSLCAHRIKSRIDQTIKIDSLEDFLGRQGNDDLIDYYKLETGNSNVSYDDIFDRIVESLSPKRQGNAPNYSNPRKTIYDKYAPILFLRETYNLSKRGNHKSAWFAGANTVRKLSQGNPRMFIRIMQLLFEKARERSSFSAKTQHEALYKFAKNNCESVQSMDEIGPLVYDNMCKIATYIHDKVHGETMISIGSSFRITKQAEIEKNKAWLQAAIANSQLIVPEEVIMEFNRVDTNTKFILANCWCIVNWIPMRSDVAVAIKQIDKLDLASNKKSEQISIFEVTKNEIL